MGVPGEAAGRPRTEITQVGVGAAPAQVMETPVQVEAALVPGHGGREEEDFDMRRLIVAILIVLLAAAPVAAAWDFEAGREFSLNHPSDWYLMARYNWKLADISSMNSQVWLLPEAGIFWASPPMGYGKIQLLFDTPVFTTGIDARMTGADSAGGRGSLDGYGRIFIRFGL